MPVIFASMIMAIPSIVGALVKNASVKIFINKWLVTNSVTGFIIYMVCIFAFSYFYTFIQLKPSELAENLNKNGGFIPGIRAGRPTAEYLSSVLSKVTLFGGIFLAAIAIIRMFARFTGLNTAFGGSSVLIVVGVAIELSQQLQSLLVMKHYKGFLEK